MVRYGMVWYGTERYGKIWQGTVGYGMLGYSTVRYSKVRQGSVDRAGAGPGSAYQVRGRWGRPRLMASYCTVPQCTIVYHTVPYHTIQYLPASWPPPLLLQNGSTLNPGSSLRMLLLAFFLYPFFLSLSSSMIIEGL